MPLGIEDIYRVPQNVAATERAREQSQRAERQTTMNIAVQQQGLEAKQAMAEIEKQQKKAETAYSKLNFANRMLATVKDDETLARAREQYLRIYPEDRENVNKVMPTKYNKNLVDQAKIELRAMSETLKPLTLSAGQKAVDPITHEVIAKGAEKEKSMTVPELTARKLAGDQDAGAILAEMQKSKIEVAEAQGIATAKGKLAGVDTDAIAKAVIEGRENIENVKNAFGVAIQEVVRSKILKEDPKFNFQVPRANIKALQSSLTQQQKNRGAMGSFVKNLNKQIDRTDKIFKDVIGRVGIRALDVPQRELKTRFIGSGYEANLEAYLVEISNEIGKLSTGSSASIRELSESAQEKWAKIHDPNLSLKELRKVLVETKHMANMRMESVEDEISFTQDMIRENQGGRSKNIDQRGDELEKEGKSEAEIMKILKDEGYY